MRPGALDKMVALIAGLVDRARDAHGQPQLSEPDARALIHAKVGTYTLSYSAIIFGISSHIFFI